MNLNQQFNRQSQTALQTLQQSQPQVIQQKQKPQKNKFNAAQYVRPGLIESEIQEIKMAFDLFDIDGGGIIDHNELKKVMTSLGFQAKNETIYQMISGLDIDGGYMIDFEEFLQLMTAKNNERNSMLAIQNVFNLFAPKRQGYITLKDLRKVVKELGETKVESELQEMIDRANSNNNARVNFDDFYKIMTKKTFK